MGLLNKLSNYVIAIAVLAIVIINGINFATINKVDANSNLPIHPANPNLLSFALITNLQNPEYTVDLTSLGVLTLKNSTSFNLNPLSANIFSKLSADVLIPTSLTKQEALNLLFNNKQISNLGYKQDAAGNAQLLYIIFSI